MGGGTDLDKLIRDFSNPHLFMRRDAVRQVGHAAETGADVAPAIPGLIITLSDEDRYVRLYATDALVNAAVNEKSRDAALDALNAALSHEDDDARWGATWALEGAANRCVDITRAIPALTMALSDYEFGMRWCAAGALARAAEKGVRIDIGKVTEKLDACVDKARETCDEARVMETRKECAGYRASIADAVEKGRQGMVMGGELLTGKPKPPKAAKEQMPGIVCGGRKTIRSRG